MKSDFTFARKNKLGLFYVLFREGTEQQNRMKRLVYLKCFEKIDYHFYLIADYYRLNVYNNCLERHINNNF